jgi:hypothetical protein
VQFQLIRGLRLVTEDPITVERNPARIIVRVDFGR